MKITTLSIDRDPQNEISTLREDQKAFVVLPSIQEYNLSDTEDTYSDDKHLISLHLSKVKNLANFS
jgi:hypothetical protein